MSTAPPSVLPLPLVQLGTDRLHLGFVLWGLFQVHGFVTEPRGAEGRPDRSPGLVDDLIRLQMDVIVAVAGSVPAVKQATSTIPIVFPGLHDPVGGGFVESLAHPGGNLTGLSFQRPGFVGKRVELLKELVPTAAPVAVLWDRGYPAAWNVAEAAARERRWKLLSLPIGDVGEVDKAVSSAKNARAGALLVAAGLALDSHQQRVVDVAAKHRLPALYHFRSYVVLGGLASYASDLLEIWRAAAAFVGKILKGAKPGDLPVEEPTKYQLVINLKTAKALGLTLPQSILLRADQVIE